MKPQLAKTSIFYDLAIIGAGPAGMMAAIAASSNFPDHKIAIIERNNRLGKKLLMTGKGRCNVTNIADKNDFFEAFGKTSKFLYPAFNRFFNQNLIEFFEKRGIKTKIERGGRVFPVSDRSTDILECLKKEFLKNQVRLLKNFRIVKLTYSSGKFRLMSEKKQVIEAQRVIIATGGKSYERTGSTGDGYDFAKNFGHTILPLKPALAPLFIKDEQVRSLAGLSLKNVGLKIFANDEMICDYFGDMIFTHQGISGPIVLKTSKWVYQSLQEGKQIRASIDLKPALDKAKLERRLDREIQENYRKEYKTLLKTLLPLSLIDLFIKVTGISAHKKNSSLNTQEKATIIELLKNFEFYIDGVAPLENAIVTSGGVDIKEIEPKTMESRLQKGLFFAGEIIALDGPTGGYNLQKAFSTGYLAGVSAVS